MTTTLRPEDLEDLLARPPYLEAGAFAAEVLARLPPPRRRGRAFILVGGALLAAAAAALLLLLGGPSPEAAGRLLHLPGLPGGGGTPGEGLGGALALAALVLTGWIAAAGELGGPAAGRDPG
jgi:hypothetical protein